MALLEQMASQLTQLTQKVEAIDQVQNPYATMRQRTKDGTSSPPAMASIFSGEVLVPPPDVQQ